MKKFHISTMIIASYGEEPAVTNQSVDVKVITEEGEKTMPGFVLVLSDADKKNVIDKVVMQVATTLIAAENKDWSGEDLTKFLADYYDIKPQT